MKHDESKMARPPLPDGSRHLDTLAVHGGAFEERTGDVAPPLHLSTVFRFSDVAGMAATFRGEREAWIYTRYGNPTLAGVEAHLARLEGAEASLVTSSGMSAISTALMTLLSAGDHLLAAADLYGGSRNLFDGILARLGIEVSYFPIDSPNGFVDGLRKNTRVVYLETPTNPTLKVIDIEAVAREAGQRGLTVVVDNTFATPLLQRPLELGCHLVVHSATKALSGHDDVTAGFIAGSAELVAKCREVMKWAGGCLDPHAAWLLERGLKTLALRVERQSSNAMAVARWLVERPEVGSVHYPGLPSHPGHRVASRQMSRFGGLLAFELKGGASAAERFVQETRLIRLAPSLGGVETICLIPAVSSHIRMTPAERQAVGISDGLIRLSCGIEDPGDLVADIERGIRS